MRENYLHGLLNQFHARCSQVENKLQGLNHVLQEIIGKELLRGQALHKVLMDKGIFTDEELKASLEKLIAESKADLEKMEKEAAEAKAKAVELLVPAGANTKPPVDAPVPAPAGEPTGTPPADTGTPAPAEAPVQTTQEAPSAEPPAANG